MENTDEERGDEINRIENLERIIIKFNIASAGSGAVLGGFGKLPKNRNELPLPERLANVQKARVQFSLTGQNVGVTGNFEDGLIAS